MQTSMNKLIVRLSKKLYDSRTFDSGQTIFFDPSWQPEEYAMLEATVISIPAGVIDRSDYHGYKILVQPGDKVLIRYDVVFAYHDQPDRDSPIYKNLLFEFNESTNKYEENWLCDILQVFAVKEGDEWQMINGYVMLNIIKESPIRNTYILTPDSLINKEVKDKATVLAGGIELGIAKGDTVYIHPEMVMRYQMNLFPFYIIKQQYILGKQL